MRKILGIIFTPIYFLVFAIIVLVFHPIQVVCYNVFGYKAHKSSVDILNLLIWKSLYIIGTRFQLKDFHKIPTDGPLIIISNHQSTYDIPIIMWAFRKLHPKFISKIELAKNIPSVSYNLKKSKAALIDRKNRAQAILEIERLGRYINENKFSAVIFPEGTRSKTGRLRKFQQGGIESLLKTAPDAKIVPFVVKGNYKLHAYGSFPMGFGNKVEYTVLDSIERENKSAEEIVSEVQNAIQNCLSSSK